MFHPHWTVGQIKSEYRKLAKLHHPDLGGDLEKMKQVNITYHAALLAANGETSLGSDGKEHTYKYNEKIEQMVMDKVLEILALNLNITVKIVGVWIWVEGTTRDQKDIFNRNGVGLKWHSEKKVWYFNPHKGRRTRHSGKSLAELEEMYGSRSFSGKSQRAVATA